MSGSKRLFPIDALRGLILVLMAVDHANYFIARTHPTGEFWGIPLPQYESAVAFLTRLVTQPCAPGFFFLMGIGMVLFFYTRQKQGWNEGRILKHFLFRGGLLIGLQFFVENSAWLLGPVSSFHPPGGGGQVWLQFGVLYGLGMAMILCSVWIRLKSGLIIGISLATIVFTQWMTPGPSQAERLFSPWLRVVFIPGQTGPLQVFYPVIPWLGCVGFGLVFGRWILKGKNQAYRNALILGIVFLMLFALVRILGGFGNIHPPESLGWMDFFHVTKYPPSVAFLLFALGIILFLLFLFSRVGEGFKRWVKPLLVYGRSSLFFYLFHLYTYGLIGLLFEPRGTGFLSMYVLWIVGLAFMYPFCLKYGIFKGKKPPESIWRFF